MAIGNEKYKIMKKITIVAAFLAIAIAGNAQTLTSKTISGEGPYLIPKLFTSSGESLLYFMNSNTVSIYDSDLSLVHTFKLKDGFKRIEFVDYDDNLFTYGEGGKFIYCSQTLFNNDENFEYVVETSEGYSVINEDGSVLFKFDKKGHMIKIGGKIYWVSYSDDGCIFYLINKQSTSIEQVASVPGQKDQIFNIEGHQLSSPRHGVNIVRKKDGKVNKVFVK